MVRVCFVCLGNICRSPTAEGIMLHLVSEAGLSDRIQVDSAGTAAYHAGESADRRSQATANARGVHLPSIARQFTRKDFERFDHVLAMDSENFHNLERLAPTAAGAKLRRLRDLDPNSPPNSDVPDPYYGGASGFEDVFDICEAGCQGLLQELRDEHGW